MHKIEDIIVNVGIITSSPFFKFNDLSAISKAFVPLLTLTPNFLELYFANSLSNF